MGVRLNRATVRFEARILQSCIRLWKGAVKQVLFHGEAVYVLPLNCWLVLLERLVLEPAVAQGSEALLPPPVLVQEHCHLAWAVHHQIQHRCRPSCVLQERSKQST
jgi:hypothetical protein